MVGLKRGSVAWLLVTLLAAGPRERPAGEHPTATILSRPADNTRSNPGPRSGDSPVREVLRAESYPWYDADADRARSLLVLPPRWRLDLGERFDAFMRKLGEYFRWGPSSPSSPPPHGGLATFLFLACAGLLLFALWRLWRLYKPTGDAAADSRVPVGMAARIIGLETGASEQVSDPRREALRRNAMGDLAGAVIWLFLDQLLTLQSSGLIRLVPGTTARTYVQALADPALQGILRVTLAAFEETYYGRRAPPPAAVERLWTLDEEFRGLIAARRSKS